MSQEKREQYRQSYDAVAEEYARRIFDELQHKPFDRAQLDKFADSVRGAGIVCDMGTGPGHIARYLQERGVDVFGLDLSEGMLAQARRLNPEIEFVQGDMLALDAPDEVWAGITACYSIIHIPRENVASVFSEFWRVLRRGGLLLVCFHLGDGAMHLDEWWGHRVSLDFTLFRTAEVVDWLRAAGFELVEVLERDPYPDVEHQSRRAYLLARKPNLVVN